MIETLDSSYQSSQMIDHLFANVDVAFVVLNLNREVMLMNRHAERLTGYTQEDMVGKSARVFYEREEDFTEQGQKRYNPDAEYTKEHYVTPYITKQGRRFWGDTQGGAVKGADGKPIYFVAIVTDVTERYQSTLTLNHLHAVTSDRNLDFSERMSRILTLGCEHFELPIGILSRIDDEVYTVEYAKHPENALKGGEVFDLSNTYCFHVFQADDVQQFHHVADSRISSHPCYTAFGLEAYIGSPIFVDGVRYGTLNFSSPDPRRTFTAQDREIIRLLAQWVGHEIARMRDIDELQQAREELERVANTDSLTRLPNRRYLNCEIERHMAHFERFSEPVTIAMVDFDKFKLLNDHYGHAAGDQALIDFATITRNELRKYDLCGRWGGEEFIIVFPNTNISDASLVIERLRQQVMASPVTLDNDQIFFTISIGLSESRKGEETEALIQRADDALYRAKEKGRNCFVTSK
ncbi:sensor domain-containing diguanylate cyclase [Vibrio ulleungensis]|uniref:diguanylate cyclase n=1 Tax=Vibrio ulleungensis TaxID=2807619 RepID=A0ABS2HEC9_9VIBR|nr:diguanylate cyclase [Vibrio ulleungensis]MBM7035441.1 diguanylate cyclase [Vibrio ulleungensis]